MTRRTSWAAVLAGALTVGVLGLAWWADRRGGETWEPRRAPIGPDSVVLLGDSITELGDWDDLLPDVPVVNAGHIGFTTEQLVAVAADVAAERPAVVLVLAGTNDIRDSLPSTTTATHYRRLVDELAASPSTTVVVQTLLPRADAPGAVDAVNRELLAIAAERDLTVLDLHEPFDDGAGGLRTDETTDGIHLSDAGYRRWADLLSAAVAELPVTTDD